ncbi:hypothetical protein CEXT_789911 [Caerostris extrusa]|uniref:Uncharacterized protein n=1 Tax=Caerostris extrusa TaxID=172846 RepID=A0AAV4M3N4_CAEEX|nr:hypothetical protein CEXT_789911 [Caerostris extrusa]
MERVSRPKGVSLSDSSELSSVMDVDMRASMEKSLARLDMAMGKVRRCRYWKPLDLCPAAASIEWWTRPSTTIDPASQAVLGLAATRCGAVPSAGCRS